jgi:pyruvate dehydrogenase (quinone)
MLRMLVADALIGRLHDWGIRRMFGYSGDGIDPILAALDRSGGSIELVTARHEETAAFMATGYAKWTGETGCCIATHGPGAIHLLNGLYDAKLDKTPVVALIAQQQRTVLGSGYQQEIDARSLYKDVCGEYVGEVHAAEQLHLVVDAAVRAAQATRSPTCVIVPHDVQQLEMPDKVPHSHGMIQTSAGWYPPQLQPDAEALQRAVEVLSSGTRPAILVGRGAAGASAAIVSLAELIGAGIAKSLRGKDVVDDELQFATGVMGHLGTTASDFLMSNCDTLLLVGTNEPYTEFLPQPGQARAVQIDIDGRHLGNRYPTEVNIAGDACIVIDALRSLVRPNDTAVWQQDVREAVRRWREIARCRAERPTEGLNPQLVMRRLSDRLPPNVRIAVDVGSVTYWYARHVNVRDGMSGHLSSTLASMGCSLPYAVAAKCDDSSRLVLALTGDGAFQMTGVNELITIADQWNRWTDPRLPVVVFDNGDLNEVTWEQREREGEPRFATSQRVPPFDYGGYARLLGLDSARIDAPDQVDEALDAAFAADRPFLVHAVVDSAMPLTPPRIEPEIEQRMLAGLDKENTATARRALQLLEHELADQRSA